MREWNGFVDGDRYHEVVETPQGRIIVEGSLHITPDAVILGDLLVEPLETAELAVGTSAMLRIWRSLMDAAKFQGYTYFVVEGVRMSGANPRRSVCFRRRV